MSEINCLMIEKMPSGGFVVFPGARDYSMAMMPLFACSTIGEALNFIRGKLDPAASGPNYGAGQPSLVGNTAVVNDGVSAGRRPLFAY